MILLTPHTFYNSINLRSYALFGKQKEVEAGASVIRVHQGVCNQVVVRTRLRPYEYAWVHEMELEKEFLSRDNEVQPLEE